MKYQGGIIPELFWDTLGFTNFWKSFRYEIEKNRTKWGSFFWWAVFPQKFSKNHAKILKAKHKELLHKKFPLSQCFQGRPDGVCWIPPPWLEHHRVALNTTRLGHGQGGNFHLLKNALLLSGALIFGCNKLVRQQKLQFPATSESGPGFFC